MIGGAPPIGASARSARSAVLDDDGPAGEVLGVVGDLAHEVVGDRRPHAAVAVAVGDRAALLAQLGPDLRRARVVASGRRGRGRSPSPSTGPYTLPAGPVARLGRHVRPSLRRRRGSSVVADELIANSGQLATASRAFVLQLRRSPCRRRHDGLAVVVDVEQLGRQRVAAVVPLALLGIDCTCMGRTLRQHATHDCAASRPMPSIVGPAVGVTHKRATHPMIAHTEAGARCRCRPSECSTLGPVDAVAGVEDVRGVGDDEVVVDVVVGVEDHDRVGRRQRRRVERLDAGDLAVELVGRTWGSCVSTSAPSPRSPRITSVAGVSRASLELDL